MIPTAVRPHQPSHFEAARNERVMLQRQVPRVLDPAVVLRVLLPRVLQMQWPSLHMSAYGKLRRHPALYGVADVLLGRDGDGEREDDGRRVIVVELVGEVIVDAGVQVETLEDGRQIVHQHCGDGRRIRTGVSMS